MLGAVIVHNCSLTHCENSGQTSCGSAVVVPQIYNFLFSAFLLHRLHSFLSILLLQTIHQDIFHSIWSLLSHFLAVPAHILVTLGYPVAGDFWRLESTTV